MSKEFIEFPKIARFNRQIIVTEKIDGTNASIHIGEDGEFLTGSRTRWITPQDDNFGFSAWAHANKDELLKLGPGTHFGEWWGSGIQRNYGLKEKRFSLFNVARWCLHDAEPKTIPSPDPRIVKTQQRLPACVGLVPVLYDGPMSQQMIEQRITELRNYGSLAAPGFMKPEGVVVFHVAAQTGFKITLEKDHEHKGKG